MYIKCYENINKLLSFEKKAVRGGGRYVLGDAAQFNRGSLNVGLYISYPTAVTLNNI